MPRRPLCSATTSATRVLSSTAPSGWYEEVICLDSTMMSGSMSKTCEPKRWPRRPKPVMTSSAMTRMSYLRHTAWIFCQYVRGGTMTPPAPMTGSPMKAATVSGPSRRIMASSSPAMRVAKSSSVSPGRP
ncbi:Uncharacterised protein [Bordetella pertussis]|nr:Uncharacterised protein [Bordetella pertussis]